MADLCRGLHERGHEIFAALRPTNEWQNKLDFIRPENILHVSIRNSFGVLSSMRIAEFIRQNQVDIVHAHLARDYIPTNIACLAARPARFFLTRHVLFPLKPFNRFALNGLAAAIAVSDAVGEGLRKVFPPGKVHIIKNGIDFTSVPSNDEQERLRVEFREFHSIGQSELLIGTLGELKELKGQRDFVIAAAEVVKAVPSARFVIVGKDNSPGRVFRRELKRLAGVLGVSERILWLDWLADTRPFYSALDIFVSPSHMESFGLAMLDAVAFGRPVIATATDGARELFGPDVELVATGEPVALGREIVRHALDASLRKSVSERNRNFAMNRFSLTQMVSQTESLYKKILGN